MADFVEDDTGSTLRVTCQDSAGTAIDLTGASAKLKWLNESGVLVSKTMSVESPETGGIVTYTFLTTELYDPGMAFEVELTLSDATILTNPDLIIVSVRSKLV